MINDLNVLTPEPAIPLDMPHRFCLWGHKRRHLIGHKPVIARRRGHRRIEKKRSFRQQRRLQVVLF